MFTRRDIASLDKEYFDVLGSSPFVITLRSKNTGHEWHLVYAEGSGWKSYRIYHRHERRSPWHEHQGRPTLQDAIDWLMDHDRYQLKTKRMCKRRVISSAILIKAR